MLPGVTFCSSTTRSFLLCSAIWHTKLEVKVAATVPHQLWSIYYAGFDIRCILEGSWFSGGRVTVTGDVWPIFSSSIHICSAQELHQLRFPLPLSLFSFPFPLMLSLPAATLLVLLHLAQPTAFSDALLVSLLLLAFFQHCSSTPPHLLPFFLSLLCCLSLQVGVKHNFKYDWKFNFRFQLYFYFYFDGPISSKRQHKGIYCIIPYKIEHMTASPTIICTKNTISQHPPVLRRERLFPWLPASTLLPWSLVARVPGLGVGVCDCSFNPRWERMW